MCGFLYLRIKKKIKFDKKYFENALKLSSYRGADNNKIIQFNDNYFGFNRLSIVGSDLSNQPLEDSEKIFMFNGEIYDYDKKFESDSLFLFNSNEHIFKNLEGQYSILIYNKLNDTIKIYRDFFGQKPLYYYENKEIFVSSSTIKSISYIYEKIYGNKLTLNKFSIDTYLLFGFIREPETIFNDVYSLESGKLLELENNKIKINSYLKQKKISISKYFDYFNKTLNHSDKQKALFLSSGIDSNFILSKTIKNKIDVNLFTLKIDKSKKDESRIVRKNIINNELIDKHQFISNKKNKYYELLNKLANIFEQPSADGLNLLVLFLELEKKTTKEKIIFSGIGGDEGFGGYNTFKYYYLIKLLKFFYFPFHFFKRLSRFSSFDGSVESYYLLYKSDNYFIKYSSKIFLNKIKSSLKVKLNDYKKDNIKNKIRFLEIFEYMKNQLLRDSDNISLFFGKEIFNPFLSTYIFANKIDNKKYLKKNILKTIKTSFIKKGFNIKFENTKFSPEQIKHFHNINDKFNILKEEHLNYLVESETNNYQKTKIALLLLWIHKNYE